MPSEQLLELILSRRSVSALVEPGPSRAQLDGMLRAACSVPDHGRLRPFRLAVIEGEGRGAFGDALAAAVAEKKPDMSPEKRASTRAKAFRSPTVIAVIATPKPGKIEVWEQHATAASAGYAIVLAAYALGVGAIWKSVPVTRGKALAELFDMAPTDEVLGFIHLGTPAAEDPDPRSAPDLSTVALLVDGAGKRRY